MAKATNMLTTDKINGRLILLPALNYPAMLDNARA